MSATPAARSASRLLVTGFGLVTSVGWNAAACAAIRAGISRPEPLRTGWLDTETFDEVPVVGHPVKGFTDGFNLLGCWLRLARGALEALLAGSHLPPRTDGAFWGETALVAALPVLDPGRFQDEDGDPGELRDALLPPLRAASALPLDPGRMAILPRGHVATAEALRTILGDAGAGRVERILLLAVDSYLDPLTVQWLGAGRRLKTGDEPTGLAPGEAAACLLLEEEGSARRRKEAPLAMITGAAVDGGLPRRGGDPPDGGRALARVVQDALAASPPGIPFAGDVVADLNGESWRAAEWGGALARLSGRLGAIRLHLPAVSLGDTGAASGAVALCHAIHLLGRGLAAGPSALVVSSSDGGEVGSIAVEAPRS